MIKAAVLGSPISHSLSPDLHRRAYEILGIPASYGAIELTPTGAAEFFKLALEDEWSGFSLTMPLKEAIFDIGEGLIFEIDPKATLMRSANTLVRRGDHFYALSTDRSAFSRLFANLKKERVAIIGGGGTARAALGALDGSAKQIDFLLRSPGRAELLSTVAKNSAVEYYDMGHSLQGYDLVVSTVPSGASDAIAAILDFTIPSFCEVLYKPFPTPLLAKAISLGSQTIDGVDLLVEQALDQIQIFSGVDFDYSVMRSELQSVGRKHFP